MTQPMMTSSPENISLQLMTFDQLSCQQLYALLELRSAIFVVEQQCIYQDMDGLDQSARHLLVSNDNEQQLAENRESSTAKSILAYARLLPPGAAYSEAAIGRILTAPQWRGAGFGRWLIRQATTCCRQLYPNSGIRLGAQTHLQNLYADCGYRRSGEPYDEDGISHVEMIFAS